MPEIGEVARAVHYIRKHLVGKTLSKVVAQDDVNVYGKVGTSSAEFQKTLTGKKVVGAGQQGKYFWMEMSTPPHPVMHFGMAGWLKFKDEHTFYYKPKKDETQEEWPPKYWKFIMTTKEEPHVEAAFCDLRRFGRIRLVDCSAAQLRKTSPLIENGPDPVIDKDIVTVEWLAEKCHAKKVPIKAMLLDQANISGIGNWVGDEIMYHAKMHPEQYCNTLSEDQIKQLHKSIHYICSTAVDLLADSDRFPESWLFKHRWGKGKKDASNTLLNGEKIVFLTVGGRTSAVVPSVQKKTGPVAKEMDEAEGYEGGAEKSKKPSSKKGKSNAKIGAPSGEDEAKPPKDVQSKKRKTTAKNEIKDSAVNGDAPTTGGGGGTVSTASKKPRNSKVKDEIDAPLDAAETQDTAPPKRKKRKADENVDEGGDQEVKSSKAKKKGKKTASSGQQEALDTASTERRRSGRLGK